MHHTRQTQDTLGPLYAYTHVGTNRIPSTVWSVCCDYDDADLFIASLISGNVGTHRHRNAHETINEFNHGVLVDEFYFLYAFFLRPHTTAAHLLYNRSFYSAQRIDNVRMFGSFLPPLQSMPYDRRNEPPHNYLKYYQ